MSLQPLDKKLRRQLENTIIKARNVAEAAAKTALERLCVGNSKPGKHLKDKPGEHLKEAMRQQRDKLRAHGCQIGDSRRDSAEQTIEHLVQETAYEQWHRMLFARFLAENSLLIYEDGVTQLSIQDCFELAEDEDGVNGWELAGRYASAMLPQIFRTENPVLTVNFAQEHQRELEKLLEALEAETFHASDSLGWVYQYWQTQKKDEVNKSGNKIGADELSAVTQLFTEPYMVSFLLDNSLGAWWVTNYPEHKDLLPFKYLRYVEQEQEPLIDTNGRENDKSEPRIDTNKHEKEENISENSCALVVQKVPAAGTFEQWPKALSELKMLDPCCGSGHFLVATLLMLVPMRMKAESLTADKAIERVLTENIHGLELDQRCVEIAAFAVALEAWRYPDSSGYRTLPSLNIAWVGQSIKAKKEDWLSLAGDDERLYYGMEALYNTFKDAPILGSLIDPGKSIAKDLLNDGFSDLQPLLNQALQQFEVAENQEAAIAAKGLTLAVDLLNQKYELIATNVPYLSRGKQCEALQDFTERHYKNAKGDIANVFLERCLELNVDGGVTQMVMPQNWLFLGSYKKQSAHLLKQVTWDLLARLGSGAFDTISGEVVNAILLSLTKAIPNNIHLLTGVDASAPKTVQEKSKILESGQLAVVSQTLQLDNPDARVSFYEQNKGTYISLVADCYQGLVTGDIERFTKKIWEEVVEKNTWVPFRRSNNSNNFFGDVSEVLLWENSKGQLHSYAKEAREQLHDMHESGNRAWGQYGVAINRMGDLKAVPYYGEHFDNNVAVIFPLKDKELNPTLLAFLESEDFSVAIRGLDQAIKVTNRTLLKVPFDLEYWTKVAQEKYPNGVPKPFSNDPTQWVFHGHPAKAEAPLQVAVARLLVHQWPAESDKDKVNCEAREGALGHMELSDQAREWIAKCESLSSFVDDDGIVCLSPVRGEKSADERLEALLMAAFGEQWNASLRNKLLSEVNCKGKSLGFWLREKFFEQHCKLFQDRPFIWHIWDGLADGFSALVNYHQLNRQNLERLIYTYLGDWIRTQDHGVKEGVDGALLRLQAAQILKTHLETILEGEDPYDIFVRWKSLAEQPIGWNPDINDGVRLNIRPFMTAPDVGKKEAGILRSKPNIKWTKDRGNNVESAPWYKLGLQYGESEGSRINDNHLSLAEKQAARDA